MRLIVRPEAEADISDAYAWYDSQQSGLGNRFIAEMSRCIADIEHQPLRFQRVRAAAPRALLRQFEITDTLPQHDAWPPGRTR